MTKRLNNRAPKRERRVVVRGVQRDAPDTRKIATALIAMARAQVEAAHAVHVDSEVSRPDPEPLEEGSA